MKVKITKKIIDYIKSNKERFEFDMPVEGEVWDVVKTAKYENACNGEPVAELQKDKKWMRIPLSLIFSDISKIIIK